MAGYNEARQDFFYVQEARDCDSEAFIQQGNILLTDPSRRDVLFGMHQQSNANDKRTLRFKNNARKNIYRTKKYTQIRQRVGSRLAEQSHKDVNLAERQLLFAPNEATVKPLLFFMVCHIKGQVDNVMQDF